MIAALGWIGAVLLALCGVPLLFAARAGDRAFLWLWFAGECAMLLYVMNAPTLDWPLVANYSFNALLVGVVLWRQAGRV